MLVQSPLVDKLNCALCALWNVSCTSYLRLSTVISNNTHTHGHTWSYTHSAEVFSKPLIMNRIVVVEYGITDCNVFLCPYIV